MQVDPVRLSKIAAAGVEQVTPAQVEATEAAATAPAGTVGQTDALVLSQQAAEVQAAHQALAAAPEARAELVESLKQQVAAGTYQVDAEKVAEKMVGQ